MKYTAFIHTNHKQVVGALVAEHALRRFSNNNDKFDVEIIHTEDHSFIKEREGELYLRNGVKRKWLYEDLQSFTPLRFMPPELMGHEGRAIVIDPDVFAAADVWELFSSDMQGKAILCRKRAGPKGWADNCLASSAMLLDCSKLTHWNVQEWFERMFRFELDYGDWICLKKEDRATIGHMDTEWNDFDKLTQRTRMLHNTRRRTQPWKAGLPIDWRPSDKFKAFPPIGWAMQARRKLFGDYGLLGDYKPHPDPRQEQFFFALVKELLDEGIVTEETLRKEMKENHVRHDALEIIDRVPRLDDIMKVLPA